MSHRRLLLVAVLAAHALGAAWWLLADGLSAEERRLVGTWRWTAGGNPTHTGWQFGRNRQCRCWHETGDGGRYSVVDYGGPWSAYEGTIVVHRESSGLRRAGRRLLKSFGLQYDDASTLEFEHIADGKLLVTLVNGERQEWTRSDIDRPTAFR